MNNQRAYSILQVKGLSDEKREITGIATTPEPDRVGDIVEPLGVKFKNPLPLLWQHRHDSPVGTVKFDKPTKNGITFTAKIAQIAEDGPLKNLVDMAWQAVKAELVRGVSIGFRPMEYSYIDGGGIRFAETEVYELSLVTIPANASATIQNIKALAGAPRIDGPVRLIRASKHSPENLNGAVRLIRCSLLGMITDDELKAAKDKDYNTQDTKFVRDMIKHHQTAIDMSTKQVGKGKNEEIIKLAKAIIDAQKGEITDMKKWLKDRGLSESGDGSMDM